MFIAPVAVPPDLHRQSLRGGFIGSHLQKLRRRLGTQTCIEKTHDWGPDSDLYRLCKSEADLGSRNRGLTLTSCEFTCNASVPFYDARDVWG